MRFGIPPSRGRVGIGTLVALALACTVQVASAWAVPGRHATGDLSARLAELARPAVRDAPPSQQADALSLAANGPGSLVRYGDRVLVEIRLDRGAVAAVGGLRKGGAEIVNVSRRFQTITAAVHPDRLRDLSDVPNASAVTEVLTPISSSVCPSGATVSEGTAQLHAGDEPGEARNVYGVDGAGVTVGILSDSFDRASEAADGSGPIATNAAQDSASGDLPGPANTCPGQSTPVDLLDDSEVEGADEGRAMAQIVHDIAPGANLAFATAFSGEIAFAENIERLAAPVAEGGAGAQAIVDDVAYFGEPFFQEGPVSTAVTRVTEDGVSYFSAAGNNNLIDDAERNIGSWEAPRFRDSGGCPAAVAALSSKFEEVEGAGLKPDHCMDFDPSAGTDTTFGISVEKGRTLLVDLQWAEPWEGVGSDIDAFLIGPGGSVEAIGIADNPGDGRPLELLAWKNSGSDDAEVQLALNLYGGAGARLKFALMQNGGGVSATEYPESKGGDIVGPTIFGHNGAKDAVSVAAINRNATASPERYSSRGPVTHYFGPVEGVAPAPELAPAVVLAKPDLTATDCVANSFFSFQAGGTWRFCGTSAAAPHAAAAAALLLENKPAATPADVLAALAGSAAPIGESGPCAVGAGLVDATAAIALLDSGEFGATRPSCEPPDSSPWTVIGEGETAPVDVPVSDTEKIPNDFTIAPIAMAQRSVDRRAPSTFFRRKPSKLLRMRGRRKRAIFRFGSNERGAVFLCRIDRGRFHRCPGRLAIRLRPGRHVVQARARDAAGNVDPTPAVYRFRVKQVRSRAGRHPR